MDPHDSSHLGALTTRLQRLPYAITLADLTQDDFPIIYLNKPFTDMTGFGQELIGHNCRVLQSDLENSEARAQIREAFSTGETVQVALRNRRKSGEVFNNLLLMSFARAPDGRVKIAVGSQYDLDRDPWRGHAPDSWRPSDTTARQSRALQLESQKRVLETTTRTVETWLFLNDLDNQDDPDLKGLSKHRRPPPETPGANSAF